MSKIDIYSSMFCPFCHRAKALLTAKGAEFNEIDVDRDPNARMEMMRRSNGGRTVPQIFIDDQLIGGSDDLAALERTGELDALLA
jgi:glutaredoxin 3